MRLRSAVLVILSALLARSYCCAATPAKMLLGYSAISATMAPLWAARDNGFFARHGIDAELIYLAGGSKIALALQADSIQIGQLALNSGLETRLAGGDLTLIGTVYDTYFFQIFSHPSITNATQLKGRVIAASSAGSASDYGIRDALESVGLRDGDYKILYVGGTDARVQSLQQGLAAAAIISPPNGLFAQKLGFRELMNLTEMKISFGYGALAAKESWLKQNRAAALNFYRGYLEALAALREDAALAHRTIAKYARINDRDVLQESYRTSIPYMPMRPYVSKDMVARALKTSKREAARRTEPEQFYDNSLIKELDDSGFIGALMSKR